jgi:hypothetical protein
MSIRVLLVCVEGTAQQEYLRASKELGAQIDIASSLNEFYEAVTRTPYNGLMIDMFTKIKYFSNILVEAKKKLIISLSGILYYSLLLK